MGQELQITQSYIKEPNVHSQLSKNDPASIQDSFVPRATPSDNQLNPQ